MLTEIGPCKLNTSVSSYNEALQPLTLTDYEILSMMGIKRVFENEVFYRSNPYMFLNIIPCYDILIATINGIIYKMMFTFRDDQFHDCTSMSEVIREFLYNENGCPTRQCNGLTAWESNQGNIILTTGQEEISIILTSSTARIGTVLHTNKVCKENTNIIRIILGLIVAAGSSYAWSFSIDILLQVFWGQLAFKTSIIPITMWFLLGLGLLVLSIVVRCSAKQLWIPYAINAAFIALAVPVHFYHLFTVVYLTFWSTILHKAANNLDRYVPGGLKG